MHADHAQTPRPLQYRGPQLTYSVCMRLTYTPPVHASEVSCGFEIPSTPIWDVSTVDHVRDYARRDRAPVWHRTDAPGNAMTS